ncbi:PREDICTED: putative E3 ubiquitin-protein ligase RF4 [Ipomoea nil]|uniref:putative E3 ubiquitin-protein ligase RF4 n=1 Tax=Ipomoea nil TaxID=35883 RepID=UPI0009016225|nr:PREDICTED: putative E3 ubiquitin-protein ligase RF4 [Ipomoea nil]
MLAALTQRKKQLEVELQGWRDWTSTKVGQAAQKLMRNNEQKKILRQDKEAAGADKWTHNAKNIYELDVALNNAKYMMETATTTHLKLQEEHTMLLKKLEDSKLAFLSPNQNLQEIKLREQELLKQCSKLEAEIRFLQEDLARLKPESAKLQQQIDKARKREHEFEILRQNEEREKIKLLEKAKSLRRERQEMNEKAKMEEDKLIAKTEENRVKYEECMKELRARISARKLGPESSSSSSSEKATAAEMKRREKECVMCLSVDRTVGLLPCAHLAFCEECSELHERLGMNDCPTCRTLIMQRIRVRFPPPKAQPKSHENRKLA